MKKKIKVVFIVFSPQMWKSMSMLFEAVLKSNDMEAILVVIEYEVKWGNKVIGTSSDFWTKMYPGVTMYTQKVSLPDIIDLDADYVFRQTPYDSRFPAKYSNIEIAKHSILGYVPYNYNFSSEMHLKIEYALPFLRELGVLFSDSKYIIEYCKEQELSDDEQITPTKMFDVGSMAIERILHLSNEKKTSQRCFTFLWIPRWAADDKKNHGTNFLRYYKNIISFFDEHKEMKCIIRPHPFMFEQFVLKGILSSEDVNEIINEVDSKENVDFDFSMDYLDSFETSDALIADYSSLIIEYFMTGKPILLCDKNCDWNSEPIVADASKKLYETYSWESIQNKMFDLNNNEDELKTDRYEIIEKYKSDHMGVADKILNILRKLSYG